jgi:GDP-4-dehydro-6-deoxy-D-mannose reductase
MQPDIDAPILVTGAAGFVGGHLLDLLEAAGSPIVAWRRPGEALPAPPTGARCRWMEVDVLDGNAVRAAVEAIRPRVAYHLAGAAHAGRSWDRTAETLRVNVMGTHHLLNALAACSRECRVLVPGSALVYAPQERALRESDPLVPSSPYALSKLAQELCAAASAADPSGPRAILTRSFNHIGPRQDPSFFASAFALQVARIEQGHAPPVLRVGNLDARRDLTDVRDTVAAYAALVERGEAYRPYNVCSGTAYRVGDVLDGLVGRARLAIEVVRDPALFRPNDSPLVLGNRERITAEAGWAPRIAMERTLDDLLAYWRRTVRDASRV